MSITGQKKIVLHPYQPFTIFLKPLKPFFHHESNLTSTGPFPVRLLVVLAQVHCQPVLLLQTIMIDTLGGPS